MTESSSIPLQIRPAAPVQALHLQSRCEICGQAFTVKVAADELAGAKRYPFTHLILHSNPIHCHVVYVDKQGAVRGSESSKSIQIDRTSATFQELVKWWTMHVEGDA
jgi:regulator of RNase E activity RraA